MYESWTLVTNKWTLDGNMTRPMNCCHQLRTSGFFIFFYSLNNGADD